MRMKITLALLVLTAACDQGSPPFDQLPLRDALRAAPEVIAALPQPARVQLAVRFESARTKDAVIDRLEESPVGTPVTLVAALDRVRQRRQSDAIVTGVIYGGAAWPIRDLDVPAQAPVLPPLEGEPAAESARLEIRALQGQAGEDLRALLAASGAHHLYRVLHWPAGAVAIDDTVYVNASWLVSLAPADGEAIDGGSFDGAASSEGTGVGNSSHPSTATGPLGHWQPASAAADPAQAVTDVLSTVNQPDAGVAPQPPAPAAQPSAGDVADDCSECAGSCDTSGCDSSNSGDDPCADSSDSGDDPCASGAADDPNADSCDSAGSDGSADGCDTSSSDGGEACASAGDGGDAASCQISRGHGRKKSGTQMWLGAPLAFLLLRRWP